MLDRRGFLKFIGGAAVGTLATPVVWKGLDDISIWSQNWPWIPSLQYGNHENTYVRTVSKLCPAAGATKIRLVGGRPVRVLSDPESPLGGGVSALAVTEVQMRYSPARLKRPLLRNSDGGYREITWEEAEKLLLEKLAAAKKQTEHDSVQYGDKLGRIWVEGTNVDCALYWGDSEGQFGRGAGCRAESDCVLPGENGSGSPLSSSSIMRAWAASRAV